MEFQVRFLFKHEQAVICLFHYSDKLHFLIMLLSLIIDLIQTNCPAWLGLEKRSLIFLPHQPEPGRSPLFSKLFSKVFGKFPKVRLAAGARSRGTVALELAPGRRGPLDNSEADRRRPTRAVQVDSDSTSKSYSNDFRPRHDRPTRTVGLPSTPG